MAAQVYRSMLIIACGCVFYVTGLSCNSCRNIGYNHSVVNIEAIREILNRMEDPNCYNIEQERVENRGGFPQRMETSYCPVPPTSSNQIYKCGVFEGRLQIRYENRHCHVASE